MRRMIAAFLCLTLLVVSCTSNTQSEESREGMITSGEAVVTNEVTNNPPATTEPTLSFGPIENESEFSQAISNLDETLTPDMKKLLSERGFVFVESDKDQLSMIYDENDYMGIGSFVTTDSVLHLYHIFYDSTLRKIEEDYLSKDLKEMSGLLLDRMLKLYDYVYDEKVKKQAGNAIVYFAVPYILLGGEKEIPSELDAALQAELDHIKGESNATCSVIEEDLDYSQFKVRGHYTKSDELQAYFKAMMWYGYLPVSFFGEQANPDHALLAMLITKELSEDNDAKELWNKINDVTSKMVGESDDLSFRELQGLLPKEDVNKWSTDAVMVPFYEKLEQLPEPEIAFVHIMTPEQVSQKQFRLMGMRYSFDIDIFTNMLENRKINPLGMDLFSALGSTFAQNYRNSILGYSAFMEEIKPKVTEYLQKPEKNLYEGWITMFQHLAKPYGKEYPDFMQTEYWVQKELNTGMASYAELKHDTILYGKPLMAQMGGEEPVEMIGPGYIEPNVWLYKELSKQLDASSKVLTDAGYLTGNIKDNLTQFKEMVDFFISASEKELAGKTLTEGEYERIRWIGGTMEQLSVNMIIKDGAYWNEITDESERNMALIADIANYKDLKTGETYSLKQAIGSAHIIYVVVKVDGKKYLTRGPVFSYYELFDKKRYTNKEWQELLKSNPPRRFDWVEELYSTK